MSENQSFRIQLIASYCYEVSCTDDPTRDMLRAQAEIQVSLGAPNSQESSLRLQEAEPPCVTWLVAQDIFSLQIRLEASNCVPKDKQIYILLFFPWVGTISAEMLVWTKHTKK